MKNNCKKRTAFLLAVLAIAGTFSGCGETNTGTSTQTSAAVVTTEDPNKELDTIVNYEELAAIEEVAAENENGAGALYTSGVTAGKVNALCYYDIIESEAVLGELFAERYGGTVETELCTSLEYFDKIATRVVADQSPDMVRYDWSAIPWGTSKNMYLALDEWLDMDAPLWAGEKDVIEDFAYAGKHYYYPAAVQSNFAIIYNKLSLEEAGLPNPMDLYFEGNWTWDTFEDMLKVWADQGEDYTAFTGGSWTAMMFANATGTKIIDLTDTGIDNNMKSQNVQRTMDWLANLKKQNYVGEGFVDPAQAFLDGKLLFLGMGLTWGFESAQESLFKAAIPYEFEAVPIPRDPQADEYYLSADTFGYMVPSGATNVQGAVSWIMCSRLKETDPEIVASERAKKMDTSPVYYPKCPECKYNFVENDNDNLTTCPECSTARKQKFKAVYSERQMQVIDDMLSGDKIKLIFDNSVGFNNDLYEIFTVGEDSVYDGPLYYGSSYTQLCEANYGSVESYLDPYREALTATINKSQ